MNLKVFLQVFGIIAVVLSILPFIPFDFWWIRSFDFPHLQLTLLTLVALLVYFIRFDIKSIQDYILVVVLLSCFIFQALKIYPYTIFSKYEVLEASNTTHPKKISIYTANVLQDNDDGVDLVSSIKKRDPDILLFTETNEKWRKTLSQDLGKDYAFKVEVPLENTYGMMLYSKHPLFNSKVMFLIEDTIPSIKSQLILASQDTLQLLAIHPAPPVPQHNPSSVDRDAEMMKVAKFSKESRFPVIVMGDFNDVAWSETTKLFQRVSGLLDMRKGRGLFNTYNADNILLRWPLDHIFVSSEFRVISVGKGENVGSDHFPFYTEISYEPEGKEDQKLEPPTKDELSRAFDQVKNEQKQED